MSKMRYFRRNQLAGNSLKRPTVATVRGNLRRHDPDGQSAAPYFANVAQGDTLIVEGVNDASPRVRVQAIVGVTANGSDRADFATLLTSINSACSGINVQAFDDGGCVGLRSTVAGPEGVVWVRGGTAADALGFADATNTDLFFAVGGDLIGATEGRGFGQPYGAVLPVPGENFSSDVFSRSIGRVMANVDVLFSEIAKNEVVVKKVLSSTALSALSDVDLGTQKVFVGLSNPTVSDLAHLFFIVDQATGQLAQSQVTSIRNGSNQIISGLDQSVVTAQAITGISKGSIVQCQTGNFVGAGVQVGDFATISDAGNVTPFSNNGYRWVVEQVIDNTHVALRPMSAAELQLVGASVDENQPTVELNDRATGAWGSIAISRGMFATGVRLTVSPPIPVGMAYDVYAAVPISQTGRDAHAVVNSGYGRRTDDFDPVPNVILTRPSLSISVNGQGVIGPFMVRLHGRAVRVPGLTITAGLLNGSNYVYWDENDGQIKVTTALATFFVSEARAGLTADELAGRTPRTAGKGHLIGVAVLSGGVLASFTNFTRIGLATDATLTVGYGGQFQTLTEALSYISLWTASGVSRPQVEILLLSDQLPAPVGGWVLPSDTYISIRGASQGVFIGPPLAPAEPYFTGTPSARLQLLNLRMNFARVIYANAWQGYGLTSSATDGTIRNVDGSAVTLGRDDVPVTALGGVFTPTGRSISVGLDGQDRARLDTDGQFGQGRVLLGKAGESDVALQKDQVDVLVGGPASDADALHTHASINADVAALETDVGALETGVAALEAVALTAGQRTALVGGGSADGMHTHPSLGNTWAWQSYLLSDSVNTQQVWAPLFTLPYMSAGIYEIDVSVQLLNGAGSTVTSVDYRFATSPTQQEHPSAHSDVMDFMCTSTYGSNAAWTGQSGSFLDSYDFITYYPPIIINHPTPTDPAILRYYTARFRGWVEYQTPTILSFQVRAGGGVASAGYPIVMRRSYLRIRTLH